MRSSMIWASFDQVWYASVNVSSRTIAARACDEVLSLPLHPGLSDADVDTVAASVRSGSTNFNPGSESRSRADGPVRKD